MPNDNPPDLTPLRALQNVRGQLALARSQLADTARAVDAAIALLANAPRPAPAPVPRRPTPLPGVPEQDPPVNLGAFETKAAAVAVGVPAEVFASGVVGAPSDVDIAAPPWPRGESFDLPK